MGDALSVYALCVVGLFAKLFALSCYQGYYRLRYMAFVTAEDAAVFKRPAQPAERAEVLRAGRAWANDLENIPLFFVLGGLALALEGSPAAIAWLSIVFTAARVLHTLAYLAGVQPWRTVFYGAGVLCLFGFAVLILSAVSQANDHRPRLRDTTASIFLRPISFGCSGSPSHLYITRQSTSPSRPCR